MIILNNGATPQTFKVIPRRDVVEFLELRLTDDQTKEINNDKSSEDGSLSYTYTDGVMSITTAFSGVLDEDHTYTFSLVDSDDQSVVYKGIIFCTNQSIEDYTINKDKYSEHPDADDKYKIYEG